MGDEQIFNPQREGYKPSPVPESKKELFVSIPKGKATNLHHTTKISLHSRVSIPKGKATNRRDENGKFEEYVFQSPKGRLQTEIIEQQGNLIIGFNPQREGYKQAKEKTDRVIAHLFQSPKGRLQTKNLTKFFTHI